MSATKEFEQAIKTAVTEAVVDPSVPADPSAIKPITENVLQKIMPALLDITNNDKWYQSKVTWGVIIAGLSTIIKPFAGDYISTTDAEEWADALATLGQFGGLALTLYGRWRAKKVLSPK